MSKGGGSGGRGGRGRARSREAMLATLAEHSGVFGAHYSEQQERILHDLQNIFGAQVDPADILDAYRVRHGGYTAAAEQIDVFGGEVRISGDLRAAGRSIGTFERSIYRQAGKVHATHDLFEIDDPAHRRMGLGRAALKKQFGFYGRAGVKSVHLDPAWDGHVVWPKMGFDWQSAAQRQAHGAQFGRYLSGYMSAAAANKIVRGTGGHAYKIAQIRTKGGERLGEQWLTKRASPAGLRIPVGGHGAQWRILKHKLGL